MGPFCATDVTTDDIILTRAVFQGVRREKLLQRFDAFVYRAVDRGGKEAALESADTATDKS